MIKLITLLLLITSQQAKEWTLVRDENNIQVYQNSNDQQKIHEYKASATIDTPIDSLFNFFLEFQNYSAWIPSCTESKLLLSNSDTAFVYYARYDLPWPFNDRDAYSLLTVQRKENEIVVKSVPYKIHNEIVSKGIVRVNDYYEEYNLVSISEQQTIFNMQGRYNPGGFIPAWLANKFIKYGPFDVVQLIRKNIAK